MSVSVTLNQLVIINGGDNLSGGDIYYEIKINGKVVVNRDRDHPITVADGATIPLNIMELAELPLIISGKVSDKDGNLFLGGDDSHAFIDDYSSGKKQTSGRDIDENDNLFGAHKSFFANDDISFRLEYEIPINLAPTPTPPDINDFGGVILYQDVNFNETNVPNDTTHIRIPLRSQLFVEGEYDLPFRGTDLVLPFSEVIHPNSVSSIKVATAYSITIFDKPLSERASGRSLFIDTSIPALPPAWNDKIMSLIVTVARV